MSEVRDNIRAAEAAACVKLARQMRAQATIADAQGDVLFGADIRLTPNVAREIARRLDGGGIGDIAVRRAEVVRSKAALEALAICVAARRMVEARRDAWENGLVLGLFKALKVALLVNALFVLSGVL